MKYSVQSASDLNMLREFIGTSTKTMLGDDETRLRISVKTHDITIISWLDCDDVFDVVGPKSKELISNFDTVSEV